MVNYRCFSCNKKIDSDSLRKRIRCPYCGSKMLFKQRTTPTKVEAI
ncbi:MAG: DNA-directed RNA polymerase subunit P [Candidatus Woesearchaeota archaeon]|nr:DNA-directed RNA polymerase subunit P [Candidatus Woesearchaeota archaeon]